MNSVTVAVIVCIIIDIPLFIFIGKLMIGSWEDMIFDRSLAAFAAICIGCILGEILLITEVLIRPNLP